MAVYEIVPNISEGRNREIIDEAIAAVESSGASLLHETSDAVHHRSVLTVAGNAMQVLDAALALAAVVTARVDLRDHQGVHPRIGALDVLPFVPLRGATMSEAVALAREAGSRIWERLGVPVFFYGEAAGGPQRRLLAQIRAGQFEGLDARFAHPDWKPDLGNVAKHPSAGAIAIGARDVLVAFNVELATGDLTIAKSIAKKIRERDGGLRSLRALGLRLSDELVQVSVNVTDYHATPLYRVVELIAKLARQHGVNVLRGEPIGLIPQNALDASARYYLGVRETPCRSESMTNS